MFELRTKEHAQQRDALNEKLIGSLVEVPVIVVQGVEIKKPSWFREADIDLDQMMVQMGNRRHG